jgi:hypothetical protein
VSKRFGATCAPFAHAVAQQELEGLTMPEATVADCAVFHRVSEDQWLVRQMGWRLMVQKRDITMPGTGKDSFSNHARLRGCKEKVPLPHGEQIVSVVVLLHDADQRMSICCK